MPLFAGYVKLSGVLVIINAAIFYQEGQDTKRGVCFIFEQCTEQEYLRRGSMAKAKAGDTVRVHYTGMLQNGMVFDSSTDGEPLEFTIGEGKVIPGFEETVVGLAVGESKIGSIPSEMAYGPHHPEMVHQIERSEIPSHIELEVGLHLQITKEGLQPLEVTIVELSDDMVTLDANHPLAGQDLIFEIQLLEIVK